MNDLGQPIAYAGLAHGVPVYDRGGAQVGVVDHVLAEPSLDIFEGLIVHTQPLVGDHLFADVDQIAELHERGVRLSVDRDELHEPSPAPGTLSAHADDTVESELEARLRKAWDWISGRR